MVKFVVLLCHGFLLHRLLLLTSFGKLFYFDKLFATHSKYIVLFLTLSHKLGSWMPTTRCPLNQTAYTFQIFFCTVCKRHNHYRATYLPLNLCHWLYTLIILNTVPLQVFTKKSKEDKICTLSCYNLWYRIFINAMLMLSLIWSLFM